MAAKLQTNYGQDVRLQDATAGSVLFANSAGELTEDNSNFNYTDSTNVLVVKANLVQATEPHGFYNITYSSVVAGTDTAFADGTQFVTSIFIPVNKTITGVAYLVGSVGGTDKVYAVLYDADGAVLANSSLTGGGATVGTAAQIQTLDLTATYAAKGPALFYVGISANGGTAKLRTVPVYLGFGIYANSVSQTHGTVAAITEPVTFTAGKAPYVYVY